MGLRQKTTKKQPQTQVGRWIYTKHQKADACEQRETYGLHAHQAIAEIQEDRENE